jgi:hypothetical protein
MGEVATYPHGTFSWIDLAAADVEGAVAFYAALFGWDVDDLARGNPSLRCRLREVTSPPSTCVPQRKTPGGAP